MEFVGDVNFDVNQLHTVLIAAPPTAAAPLVGGRCEDDWVAWGGHCYLFPSKKAVPRSKAMKNCKDSDSEGGILTTVHSRAENTFIATQAKAKLGGRGASVWIGMKRDKDGEDG